MTLKIYSIFDLASDIFGTPFFSTNDQTALRSFNQLKTDPHSMVRSCPQDFKLYCLGIFDDASGKIIAENYLVPDGFAETDDGTYS